MKQKNLKLIKNEAIEPPPPAEPELSAAELAEIARFKELTIKRAVKRAAVSRLIAKLQHDDSLSNAA